MSISITCNWEWTIYEGDGEYRICRYRMANGEKFAASGVLLPTEKALPVTLVGDWKISDKGKTFIVETFSMEIPKTKEGTVAYLCSLRCGLGSKLASRVYETYGDKIWDVIEKDPEKITTEVKGCKRVNAEALREKYHKNVILRELVDLFDSLPGFSIRKLQRMAVDMGVSAVSKIKKNPYLICTRYGCTFADAEALAAKLNIPAGNVQRVIAAVYHCMTEYEQSGNVFMIDAELLEKTNELLTANRGKCREEDIEKVISFMMKKRYLIRSGSRIYRATRWHEENRIATDLTRLMSGKIAYKSDDLDALIDEYQKEANITLAPQQRAAIVASFDNAVHIITGGPGTGKSTILKGILHCHHSIAKEKHLKNHPILMAPTGRAARRMRETTGEDAMTIHKALGLRGDTENSTQLFGVNEVDASMVIVDEASMMDSRIASILFSCIKTGTQVIIVGDIDQLPSVGAGSVLGDLIASNLVATTRLTEIFRQAGENPIVVNSQKINAGDHELTWAKTFKFIQAESANTCFDKAKEMYVKCVSAYGMDNVALLCPYRKKGTLSVSHFNEVLQSELNPLTEGQETIKINGTTFRAGDRVMQTKNVEGVSNGDIGYILDVKKSMTEGIIENVATIRFNDEVTIQYRRKDMENISLAFCTTIHKSQGSEYQTVIVVLHSSHSIMLKRNLIYTAITRASKNCCIIGDEKAIQVSIDTVDTNTRCTDLCALVKLEGGAQLCQEEMSYILGSVIGLPKCKTPRFSKLGIRL